MLFNRFIYKVVIVKVIVKMFKKKSIYLSDFLNDCFKHLYIQTFRNKKTFENKIDEKHECI